MILPKTGLTNADILYPGQTLTASQTLNFIVPYIQGNMVIGIYRGDILRGEFETISGTTDTNVLFNDNLRNMQGYRYKALLYPDDKRLRKKDKKFFSPEIQLMQTIAEKQNATFYPDSNTSKVLKAGDAIVNGEVDMILNLGSYSGAWNNHNFLKTVNTYETNGLCALVPIPLSYETFLKFIIKPFHENVWYALILALVLASLVWQTFYKLFDDGMVSGLNMIMDIMFTFIQQSVNIRRGRFVLIIMLQIFIFMMVIFANVYQGVVTSILMEPTKHVKANSIYDLLYMEYDFYSDNATYQAFQDYDNGQEIVQKIKPLEEWLYNSNYIKQFQNVMAVNSQNVLIVLCNAVDELLETQIDENTRGYDVYYHLPQKVLSFYEKILLPRQSPFHERLSELSLRIHESGIKQHWSMMMKKFDKTQGYDPSVLKMAEMKPIFKTYLQGMVVAFLVFLVEFFKNGLKQAYRKWIKGCLRCINRYVHRRVRPRMQKN